MRRILLICVMCVVVATAASAQSNLGIEAGAIFPFGKFGDTTDPSPYIGVRWERQDVNALGQTAVMSYIIRGGYSTLKTQTAFKNSMSLQGREVEDGTFFDVGLATRVYSKKNPLFVGAGASYVDIDRVGNLSGDKTQGIGGFVGLGLSFGGDSVKFDLEGRAAVVAAWEGETLTWGQALLAIAFPF
jgi:hypothetical protein